MQLDLAPSTHQPELSDKDVSELLEWQSPEEVKAAQGTADFIDPSSEFADPRDPLSRLNYQQVDALIEHHAEVQGPTVDFSEASEGTKPKEVTQYSVAEVFANTMAEYGFNDARIPVEGGEGWSDAEDYLGKEKVARLIERVAALNESDEGRKVQIKNALVLEAVAQKAREDAEVRRSEAEKQETTNKSRQFGSGILRRFVKK